jgi:hypothetical protein
MNRNVDERKYLTYLFHSLNVEKLKKICKEFEIKGYSRYKKKDLIEFIIDSLSEEEISSLIKHKELEIISDGIDSALGKINGTDRESIKGIKIINPDIHEIELTFKGMNWETESFLSITSDNMDDPERDCDCRIGSEMGFCGHFWVGFIFSLKKKYFKLNEWSLTVLPDDFEKKISLIKIPATTSDDTLKLVDETSEDFSFMDLEGKSITIYDGEINKIEEKEQVFQEITTKYYLISLKNISIGPKIQKKSDYREEDIQIIDELAIRISQKLFEEKKPKLGDKINVNGKLTKDNFLRLFIVKNIRKIVFL